MPKVAILAFLLAGCASLMPPRNIEWAHRNNIPIVEINPPSDSWATLKRFLVSTNMSPDVITVINIPPKYWDEALRLKNLPSSSFVFDSGSMNFVLATYPCYFFSPSTIYRMGDYPCLNHEVGHVREYREGVPYHSKYAY